MFNNIDMIKILNFKYNIPKSIIDNSHGIHSNGKAKYKKKNKVMKIVVMNYNNNNITKININKSIL